MMTDGRIQLGPVKADDAEELYRAVMESAASLSPWMPWYHAGYSLTETLSWCRATQINWEEGLSFDFTIKTAGNDTLLGICGLNHINHDDACANLGFWVRTGRTGQGFATAAAMLLARFGFETLGLNRIEIMAARSNTTSQRVAEKTGAVWEGVLRNRLVVRDKLYDAALFSLLAKDLVD